MCLITLSNSRVTYRFCPRVGRFPCGARFWDMPGSENHLVLKCRVWSPVPEMFTQFVWWKGPGITVFEQTKNPRWLFQLSSLKGTAVWGYCQQEAQKALSNPCVPPVYFFGSEMAFGSILWKVVSFLIPHWFSKCGPRTPSGSLTYSEFAESFFSHSHVCKAELSQYV